MVGACVGVVMGRQRLLPRRGNNIGKVTHPKRHDERAHDGSPHQQERKHGDDIPRQRLSPLQLPGDSRCVLVQFVGRRRGEVDPLGCLEKGMWHAAVLDLAALADELFDLELGGDLGSGCPPTNFLHFLGRVNGW